jgi:hypothetical protein
VRSLDAPADALHLPGPDEARQERMQPAHHGWAGEPAGTAADG